MTIVRLYLKPIEQNYPSNYREAWWEEDSHEFVVHHGVVGDQGKTSVEKVNTPEEAESMLASFATQGSADGYVPADDIEIHKLSVTIDFKGKTPTQVESSNAHKYATEYNATLAWRGLGTVEDHRTNLDGQYFEFDVYAVHPSKARKTALEVLKVTDFRKDRLTIRR